MAMEKVLNGESMEVVLGYLADQLADPEVSKKRKTLIKFELQKMGQHIDRAWTASQVVEPQYAGSAGTRWG